MASGTAKDLDFELEEGDSQRKYFDLLDLAVVWSAAAGASGQYEVTPYDGANWQRRSFYGATHFITRAGSEHRVDVISISDLVRILDSDE